MFVTLSAILLVALSGTVLTYLYEREDSLLVRVCAGNIIGSALFGLICFLVACGFGFSVSTVTISLSLTLLFSLLLIKKNIREELANDWRRAREKLDHTDLLKTANFLYYLFFVILFCFFFNRVMIENAQGIFTGGSQNLGDLPFHLGAIFSFSEGGNVPPENPSFAFAKFTYPFMADFLAACFVKLGAGAKSAMLWQNVSLAFSLVVLFEKFAFALTKNRLAAKLAPVIFFFSGGLGFLLFFRDYWQDGRSFFEFVWNLQKDYTIRSENLRWGNPLVVLFMTQRSLLLGMPIALIVLTELWKIFVKDELRTTNDESQETNVQSPIAESRPPITNYQLFFVGLLAGTLPLVHVHSLAVLFIVTGFLFVLRLDRWRDWLLFGIGTAIISVPELVWAMTGSATNLGKFVEPFFGWHKGQNNFFFFWLINLGLFFPLLLAAVGYIFLTRKSEDAKTNDESQIENDERQITHNEKQRSQKQSPIGSCQLLYFYLPFAFLFVAANTMKLAPWEWDNIKVLIYWFVGSVPLVALLLAKLWEKNSLHKAMAAVWIFVLISSGAIDVWRVVSKQINYQVFNQDAIKIAEQIKQKTSPQALFLNAPTYNSAVVLSGRRSLMRYTGHLGSYGIDYGDRESEVKRIYEGTALADSLIKKNGIEYIIVSPEETANNMNVNEEFLSKFPVIIESGAYRVYQVK